MRAIEAETFSGYGGLRQIELPKPQPATDRVLVRLTAAGVTPLDHTILSGGHHRVKAPLVLGNEGAGVIEVAGDSGLAVGSRVMFSGSPSILAEISEQLRPMTFRNSLTHGESFRRLARGMFAGAASCWPCGNPGQGRSTAPRPQADG